MALLDTIKTIIELASPKDSDNNPTYTVHYEESKMMNIKVDELKVSDSFVYIEEFISGKYTQEKFFKSKSMKMQIYFCKFSEFQCDAIDRQTKRDLIEEEIIEPFMQKYKESGLFDEVQAWNIFYPFPRFDANEVSVMLEFDCKVKRC